MKFRGGFVGPNAALPPAPGPSQVKFIQQPTNVGDGFAFSPVVTVGIYDLNGNFLPTATNVVTVAIYSGPSQLTGTVVRAAVNGVATFTGLSVLAPGTNVLVATSPGLSEQLSQSFVCGSSGAPDILEDFSTYTNTQNFSNDPRGLYAASEDLGVERVRTGTIVGQAITAGNPYTVVGVGTLFTTEAIVNGVMSCGAVKLLITAITNDLLLSGTAVTTGTLTGAYSHPNFSNFLSPQAFCDIVLDKTVGYGALTQCWRTDRYDRTAQGGSGQTGRCTDLSVSRSFTINTNGGLGEKELWVEIAAKFSPGWVCAAPGAWGCTSGIELKLFHLGVTGGAGRFGLELHNNDPMGGNEWEIGLPTDPQSGYNSVATPLPSAVTDGNWHVFRMHAKVSSANNVADGLMKTYWDGNLISSDVGQIINRTGINLLEIERNQNQGPGTLQSEYYGKVQIWFAANPPGW